MDNFVINELKQKYDLTKDSDILALYAALQAGQYKLVTPEERAFDDEVYELAMAVKEGRRQTTGTAGVQSGNFGKTGAKAKRIKSKKVVVLTRQEMRIKRLITTALLLFATGCLIYFGAYCYESYRTQQENERLASRKENEMLSSMFKDQTVTHTDEETGQEKVYTVLDEYKSLLNQNKNLIGWLKIADTNIDYPVMQTDDNEYYLDHDVNNESDKNGTLFMDYQCDVLKPSSNFIIYGHNMRSGNMFGNLDKYKSESYYKEHPVIMFDTIYEKGIYQIMYAFNSRIYTEDEITFKYYQMIDITSEKEFESNMKSMQEIALYNTGVEAVYGDQLLTLSTCDYGEDDGRFVVVAKRVQ
ncbi:MAG: class B sortase [Lachnospiraceae bacterium]|nr:class B sortase [Lachnospiraceae bacterium]